ncbi:MAG: DUF3892 domain-containing protein [Mucilaginibacter sp.]|jgi:hypothetical protein|uniref:DUF3892 domain-containing protein n=1 Tax=Mucilaginibacter sp. TaxID=1882438 RepID=UPI00356A3E3E
MASYQVVCITKPDVDSSHEHITQIGYKGTDGLVYLISVKTAIERIEKNSKEFYVSAANETVYVIVYERDNKKFIKTKPDDTKKDNLLKLRQCNK